MIPNPCLDIHEASILLKVDKKYNNPHSSIYDITRGLWRVNKNRISKVEYAFIVVKGTVIDVFKIDYWEDAPIPHVGRSQFVGKRDTRLADKYKNKVVQPCFGGGRSSFKYENV